MVKYFQIQIMNESAKRCSNYAYPNELGYMGFNGESKPGKCPCQKIKVNSKIVDFYMPSPDLGSRQIISTQVRDILEEYRDDNLTFIHCPLTMGSQIKIDFWITDVKEYDDQVIDFNNSRFKLIEGWIEKEVNGIAKEFGQKISDTNFENLDELRAYEENDLNYLSSIKIVKLSVKEDCTLPNFFLRNFGIFDLIVSEDLKGEIQNQKLDKGIEFKPLEIPDEEWYGPNGLRKQFYS